MYELHQAGDRTYFIQSPAKIGVFLTTATDAYLIDSGSDKDAGRKAMKILTQNGWQLKGIVNTHSHADHIGGNAWLQKQTGCVAFSNAAEGAFTRCPPLEPSLLWGGYPMKDLRHKFLQAQPSDALEFDDPAFPDELTVIPLPGHSIDMVGLRTPDDAVFLADCLCSRETLDKYGIPFLYDVEQYLHTLDQVADMQARLFIPSHADATDDIKPLALYNKEKTLETADILCDFIKPTPATFEDILRAMFRHYTLTMSAAQYVLVGSTIRSYLGWLKDAGRISFAFEDNRMLWQTV